MNLRVRCAPIHRREELPQYAWAPIEVQTTQCRSVINQPDRSHANRKSFRRSGHKPALAKAEHVPLLKLTLRTRGKTTAYHLSQPYTWEQNILFRRPPRRSTRHHRANPLFMGRNNWRRVANFPVRNVHAFLTAENQNGHHFQACLPAMPPPCAAVTAGVVMESVEDEETTGDAAWAAAVTAGDGDGIGGGGGDTRLPPFLIARTGTRDFRRREVQICRHVCTGPENENADGPGRLL